MPDTASAHDLLAFDDVPCNLCGSREASVVFQRPYPRLETLKDDARMTTDVFGNYGRIVRCRGCGLVYTNPRPMSETICDSYAEMEDEDYCREQECRSINAHIAMRLIKRHAKGGKLLDIGCSTGFLLNAARLDFEPHGVEPSAWAAAHSVRRLGLNNVTHGFFRDGLFPPASFDVVTMCDVIEHLGDPKGDLTSIHKALKPGGILYLVTPNIRSLSARLLGGYWWGLRPAHIFYFSDETMRRMLDECGFDVVESRSFGRIFTLDYWLGRLRNYPRLISWLIDRGIAVLGVRDKIFYINTRDSMEIVARKRV